MKCKSNFIKIISMCMVFIISVIFFSACKSKIAEPINLPNASDIESVTIFIDNMSLLITDLDWIFMLHEKTSYLQPTAKDSIQDVPNVPEYIKIDFALKSNNNSISLFLYQEKDKWYLEQPYQGVYIVEDSLIDMIHMAN